MGGNLIPFLQKKIGFHGLLGVLIQVFLSWIIVACLVLILMKFVPGNFSTDDFLSTDNQATFNTDLLNIMKFRLGPTLQNTHLEVTDYLLSKARVTVPIGVYSLILTFLLVFIFLFFRKTKAFRNLLFIVNIVNSLPALVLIPTLVLTFSFFLEIFPIKFDPYNEKSLIFIVIVLSIKPMCHLIPLSLNRIRSIEKKEFVKYARAKGLSRWQIDVYHIWPMFKDSFIVYFLNLLIPVIIGSLVLESAYSIPGLGTALIDAIFHRDVPIIIGYTYWMALLSIIVRKFSEFFSKTSEARRATDYL